MPDSIISQFEREFAAPIETSRQVNTIPERDAIPTNVRWEGMIVYVLSEKISYELRSTNLDNTGWTVYGGTDTEANHYRGLYNATTGLPAISDGTGDIGDEYLITGAASPTDVDFGSGDISLQNGDIIMYDGSVYFKKVDNNQAAEVSWGDITGTLSDQTDLQTALNAKQATITGAASTITTSDLTANRALLSNASGKVAVSAVTNTELGYLSGVTSAIQTQLNTKIPTSRSVLTGLHLSGGGDLSANRTLTFTPTVNNWVVDSEGNQRFYFGSTATAFAGWFKASAVGQVFEFRNSGNSAVATINSSTGAAEFGGTVSGDDPVNADDFVTKGYADSNYGATMVDTVTSAVSSSTVGLGVVIYTITDTDLSLTSSGDYFEFQFMFTLSGATSNTIRPRFTYGSTTTTFSTYSNNLSGDFNINGYGVKRSDNSVAVYFETTLNTDGYVYKTLFTPSAPQNTLTIAFDSTAAHTLTLQTGYIRKYEF